MPKAVVFVLLLVLAASSAQMAAAYPETREYIVGDIDNFVYNGPGSADDVYVDPNWLAYVGTLGSPENGIQDFDQLVGNHRLPFTFLFDLHEGERVVGGTLTLAFRQTASQIDSDGITFTELPSLGWFHFTELGWLPITYTGTSLRSLDLSNVLGTDVLYLMQDGRLNVLVEDDTAIDYARLTVQVTPEPASLALLAVGGLAVLRRHTKRA